MPEPTEEEEEERQRVLAKMERVIERLRETQRVADHVRAGGSWKEPWVQEYLSREDDDDDDESALGVPPGAKE